MESNESSATERVVEGWFGPGGSRKYHYFDADLRSLCGKWMLWAHPEDAGMEWDTAQEFSMQGDCAGCTKKLAARVAESSR